MTVANAIPWLFNKAKFYYSHVDGEGKRIWQANAGGFDLLHALLRRGHLL